MVSHRRTAQAKMAIPSPLAPVPSGDNQILADDLRSGVLCLFLANLGIAANY